MVKQLTERGGGARNNILAGRLEEELKLQKKAEKEKDGVKEEKKVVDDGSL